MSFQERRTHELLGYLPGVNPSSLLARSPGVGFIHQKNQSVGSSNAFLSFLWERPGVTSSFHTPEADDPIPTKAMLRPWALGSLGIELVFGGNKFDFLEAKHQQRSCLRCRENHSRRRGLLLDHAEGVVKQQVTLWGVDFASPSVSSKKEGQPSSFLLHAAYVKLPQAGHLCRFSHQTQAAMCHNHLDPL